MSIKSIDNANNELTHMKNKASCEIDLSISKKLTGAHDRPAIFIDNNNDDYNDSTTLSILNS